jgi:RNA polymerase sigma-70 factor (ECF subfamily)
MGEWQSSVVGGVKNRHARHPLGMPSDAPLDFASIYDTWFDRVSRWLGTLGAPDADREDLAQEVFLVVRRRLRDFDGRNVAGWLYRIASRKVGQHRRRRLLFNAFFPKQPIDVSDLPHGGSSAVADLETKEKQLLLERLLSKMSERRRIVFALFEVEGYAGDEIADMLDIPINTVWTRLHHARKDFFERLAQHRRVEREVS